MGEPKRPDMKRWLSYADQVVNGQGQPVASRDYTLLVSLVGAASEAVTALRRGSSRDVDAESTVTLLVPSAGWERPGMINGAQLLGVAVRLDDRVEWPSLLWEIP